MLISFQIAILCAVVAYVHTSVLIKPGHIFGGVWARIKSFLTKEEKILVELPEELQGITEPEYHIEYKEHWLLKPLGGCALCFGGQLSLWYYIFTQPFNLINLIFSVCLTILLTKILLLLK